MLLLDLLEKTDFFDSLGIKDVDISQLSDANGFEYKQETQDRKYTVKLSRNKVEDPDPSRKPWYNLYIINNSPTLESSMHEVLSARDYIFAGRVIEGDFQQAARLYLASIAELNRRASGF